MLDSVYTVMYDPLPVSECSPVPIVSECRDWTSVFPHLWCVILMTVTVLTIALRTFELKIKYVKICASTLWQEGHLACKN